MSDDVKQVGGVWLPAHEQHMSYWMTTNKKARTVDGKLTYQYHKLEAALQHVRVWDMCIDVGGHVGLWAMHLSKRFDFLHAFEPVSLHRKCFAMNMPANNYMLHKEACGAAPGKVTIITTKGSSGDSKVDPAATGGDVDVVRLDDALPGLTGCGLIKLDCEGYEIFALQGAAGILQANRPVVVVEQKHNFAEKYGQDKQGAVLWLREKQGYRQAQEIGGDFIMVPGEWQ
jgi:FkbM family methyltransferase